MVTKRPGMEDVSLLIEEEETEEEAGDVGTLRHVQIQ